MSSQLVAECSVSQQDLPTPSHTHILTCTSSDKFINDRSESMPYILRTLENLRRLYASSSEEVTHYLSQAITHPDRFPNIPKSNTRPTVKPEEYHQSFFTKRYPFPNKLPFLGDECGVVIPSSKRGDDHILPGIDGNIMEVVVEALRQSTKLHLAKDASGVVSFYFNLPTSEDVMQRMSEKDGTNYPATVLAAHGWKNTVNQCLTAGQGINFLSYDVPGTKNHRYMLLERAFNGSLILGSGKCRVINNLKPKKSKKGSISIATVPAPFPSSSSSSSSSSPPVPVQPPQTVLPPAVMAIQTLVDLELPLRTWSYTAFVNTTPDLLSSWRYDANY